MKFTTDIFLSALFAISPVFAATELLILVVEAPDTDLQHSSVYGYHEGAAIDFVFLSKTGTSPELTLDTETRFASYTEYQHLGRSDTALAFTAAGNPSVVSIDNGVTIDGQKQFFACKDINDPYGRSKYEYAVTFEKVNEECIPIEFSNGASSESCSDMTSSTTESTESCSDKTTTSTTESTEPCSDKTTSTTTTESSDSCTDKNTSITETSEPCTDNNSTIPITSTPCSDETKSHYHNKTTSKSHSRKVISNSTESTDFITETLTLTSCIGAECEAPTEHEVSTYDAGAAFLQTSPIVYSALIVAAVAFLI
ncbi:hypothetical protein B5S28_g2168 [[Candida] boidinii]|nr:hypothetical protein B5S28_g2168 [[Candida] boidinii]OWB63043.1 hypothetical protein B5S29_g3997 [[Candida] boidinii]